jgi:hypothetical protein
MLLPDGGVRGEHPHSQEEREQVGNPLAVRLVACQEPASQEQFMRQLVGQRRYQGLGVRHL